MDEQTVRIISGAIALLCVALIAYFIKYVIGRKSPAPGSLEFLSTEIVQCMTAMERMGPDQREPILTQLSLKLERIKEQSDAALDLNVLHIHLATVARQRQSLGMATIHQSGSPAQNSTFIAVRLYELTLSALLLELESGDSSARQLIERVYRFVHSGSSFEG